MMPSENHPIYLFNPKRLKSAMEKADIDGVVAHSRFNYYYLSGFKSLDYLIDSKSINFILIPRDLNKQSVVIIPTWESMSLRNSSVWVPEIIFSGQYYIKDEPSLAGSIERSVWEALKKAIISRELEKCRVGFELDQLPVILYERLTATFPHMEIVDASSIFRILRMIKTNEEVHRIQKACEIAEQASDAALFQMRPGMTEREVAQEIAKGIIQREGDILYVQVATGAVAGQHLPSDRRIIKGDIIRTDVSVLYKEYVSDIGRTYVVGPPTPEQAQIYQVAYKALQAGIAAVEPERLAKDIFDAAMAVWAEAGYKHIRRHHVGHGIGLEAHESPVLKHDNNTVIEIGMVLAVEVPYYVYQLGGFAPEDILFVGPSGNSQFTNASAEIPIVG